MKLSEAVIKVADLTGDKSVFKKAKLLSKEYRGIISLLYEQQPLLIASNRLRDKFDLLLGKANLADQETQKRIINKLNQVKNLESRLASVKKIDAADDFDNLDESMLLTNIDVLKVELRSLAATKRGYKKSLNTYHLAKTLHSIRRVSLSIFFGLFMFTLGISMASQKLHSWLLAGLLIPAFGWGFIEFVLNPWLENKKMSYTIKEMERLAMTLFSLETVMFTNKALDMHLKKFEIPNNRVEPTS